MNVTVVIQHRVSFWLRLPLGRHWKPHEYFPMGISFSLHCWAFYAHKLMVSSVIIGCHQLQILLIDSSIQPIAALPELTIRLDVVTDWNPFSITQQTMSIEQMYESALCWRCESTKPNRIHSLMAAHFSFPPLFVSLISLRSRSYVSVMDTIPSVASPCPNHATAKYQQSLRVEQLQQVPYSFSLNGCRPEEREGGQGRKRRRRKKDTSLPQIEVFRERAT